jgi:tRNA threonylcarbamoyladenosine biosynthesis protein TsaB
MIILSIRTDKPEAEIGLFNNNQRLAYHAWEAHRQLAETLHQKIRAMLEVQGKKLQDIDGIVVYEGPGSFTGLRIGISVANALSYGLQKPVAGASGVRWLEEGRDKLGKWMPGNIVVPFYGSDVHITLPRK